MAQYSKSVPKNPLNSDETLGALLKAIIFYTKGGDKLTDHQILSDTVVLTFDDGEP